MSSDLDRDLLLGLGWSRLARRDFVVRRRSAHRLVELALAAHLLAEELLDLRLLADAVAQEIELGAAHFAAAGDDDVFHARAVQREHPLDAFALHDAAHRDAAADAATL